jgi:hypothetical protein
MSKKTILVLFVVAFLFGFKIAHAEVVISEIMYNPVGSDTNTEWIEVHNTGSSSVDLSSWYISDYDTSWHYHAITPENLTNINADAYALIVHTSQSNFADFKTKNPSFNGLLFRSSFTLGNSGGRLGMSSDRENVVSDISYVASADTSDTGNSLQLISGLWEARTPTPGKENEIISTPPIVEENINPTTSDISVPFSSTQGEIKPKTKTTEVPKIKTKITAKTLVFSGIPVEFSASATGLSNEPLLYGKYFWNFGDGDSKEMRVNDASSKFTHTFFYEGEYTVALEYYMNYYSENPDASDEISIRVVSPDVSISKIGDEKDFFVEISNNTDYDADLSKWILSGSGKSFTLPKNMILEPQKKIILSPQITGFSFSDKDALKLENPQGETIFDCKASIEPVKVSADNSIPVKISLAKSVHNVPIETLVNEDNTKTKIPADNLTAQAIKSDVNTPDTTNNSKYGILGLFAFLGIGASAAYFIRNYNKKSVSGINGDNFEIIDE